VKIFDAAYRGIMEKKFIMTAFTKDSSRIVAYVTEVIYENGCSLEDSTMTLMLNEFAIILTLFDKGNSLKD
jgi:glycine cleavage system transcriptional repressor